MGVVWYIYIDNCIGQFEITVMVCIVFTGVYLYLICCASRVTGVILNDIHRSDVYNGLVSVTMGYIVTCNTSCVHVHVFFV